MSLFLFVLWASILVSSIGLSAPPGEGQKVQVASVRSRPTVQTLAPANTLLRVGAALPDEATLLAAIDQTLDFTQNDRELSLDRHAAWQLMHGVLAFGRDFVARRGEESVSVLDWALAGKPMTGWDLRPTDRGVRAEVDPGQRGQGHEDQWLSIIAQCGVKVDDALVVDGKTYKVFDLLRRSLYDCYEGKETSWTVIALSNYLDPIDQNWIARDGETWNLARLVGMEVGPAYDERLAAQHVNDAACGGTHRLVALTMAANRFRKEYPDIEMDGAWRAAQERVTWAVDTARDYQLPTGAFSILYFHRPANSTSIDEHLAATGHTLEFLSFALSDEEIRAPWVKKAVVYLCDLMQRTRHIDLECGGLYHAAHGLVLYRQRIAPTE